MEPPLISDPRELDAWCDRARERGRVGLDTEFLWERTYAPRLCLVQIAVDRKVALVDPLAKDSTLDGIADLIDDPDVETVMHAPHADLVAFAAHYDCSPANILDTQIAAGFVGLGIGLSYERLVEAALDRELAGGESFTDWSKRPLRARQLEYAAADVEHLSDLADLLHERLADLGRNNWARQELSERFEQRARLVVDPDQAYRKVARSNRVTGRHLGALRALAAWRERTARTRDVPTSWLVKDATLVELARRHPHDLRSLRRVRGAESMNERDARELLTAIAEGLERPVESEEGRPPPSRNVRERIACSKGVASSLLKARCEAAGIAAELVATTSEVEALIAHVAAGANVSRSDDTAAPTLLTGWRREVAGLELVELLEGRIAMRLIDRPPFIELGDVETAE